MSCGVGHRGGSDPALLWLWPWPWPWPAATALIGPLAWELPYAMGMALKSKKQKIKIKKRNVCVCVCVCVCVYTRLSHFAVQQKLAQHCKSTVL